MTKITERAANARRRLEKLRAVAGSTVLLAAASLLLAPATQAAKDEWSFGIGTGLSLLSLDGDVGAPLEGGGRIFDLDLGNDDTSDAFESAFGFASFANKGRWTIHLGYATLKLEDSDSGVDAEWDRAEGTLAAEYMFYQAGKNQFGVLAGIRYYDHDWDVKLKDTNEQTKPDDDWTDGVIGLTHRVPFAKTWAWTNRAEYMGGDSEGGFTVQTALHWKPYEHWVFTGGVRYQDLEYGDKGDIDKSDFYYYDVDETTINLGFMYVW